MTLLSVLSKSPWRLTVAVDGAPSLAATDYAIARQDGLAVDLTARRLWLVGTNTVEIALSGQMLDSIVYVLTLPNAAGAPSQQVAYRQTLNPTAVTEPAAEDIEAEAYGVDTDWLSGVRSPTGDLVDVRGVACLKNDLMAVAVIEPGEIYHRPNIGAGLKLDINGPGTNAELARQRGAVVAQWRADSRVSDASASTATSSTGQITLVGNVVDAVASEKQSVVIGGK